MLGMLVLEWKEQQTAGDRADHLTRILAFDWQILSGAVPYGQVLIKMIKHYTWIIITFISGELNIDPADVESLLVSCILDNTVRGRIDQVSVNIMMAIKLFKNPHGFMKLLGLCFLGYWCLGA